MLMKGAFMKHKHLIKSVLPGSIAEELEIEAGDKLISINDSEIEDVFDYHFYVNDEYLTLLVEKANGEEWELEIEKDYEEDLGIDLITLLKASMNGFYSLYISGGINPNKWEPWCFITDMKNRCFRSLTVVDALGKTIFYFKDYGKTWTLIDEELENE